MAYRVYISPSVQDWNVGVGNYGTEEQRMQAIGERVETLLKNSGFTVFRNKPEMSLQEIAKESNNLAVDIHVAIHSNAGGGQGTEVWYYEGSVKGKKLAQVLYNEVAPLSPSPDRGIKTSTKLYELRKTKAPAVIIEVAFHDNVQDAVWIINHTNEIAAAIARAICKYFNVPFKESKITINSVPIILKGKQVNVPSTLVGGMTLTHIRPILEALGHQVDWRNGKVYVDTPINKSNNHLPTSKKRNLPTFKHFSNCDVITALPEHLEVATVKGPFPIDRSGINGGYLDENLNPLGIVVINGKVIADRVPWRPPRSVFCIWNDTGKIRADILPGIAAAENLGFHNVLYALGAGPLLLPSINYGEGFEDDIMNSVRPRSAVGITEQGEVKLITTDAMSLEKLRELVRKLRCVQAMNLDGGSSSQMRWNSKTVRHGRNIATAILIREGLLDG